MEISVEVVDTTAGTLAAGMPVSLDRDVDGGWQQVAVGRLGPGQPRLHASHAGQGYYRLRIDLGRYFLTLGTDPSLSRVELVFRVFEAEEPVRLLLAVSPAAAYICRTIRASG